MSTTSCFLGFAKNGPMTTPLHGPFLQERAATQKPQMGFGSACFLATGAAAASFVVHITAAGRHATTSVALAARSKKSKNKKSKGNAQYAAEKMDFGKAPREKVENPTWDLNSQIGAVAPLGGFDPLELIGQDEQKFKNFRQAELKHGRVAMLASVGALVEHYVKIPVLSEPGNKENSLFAVMLLASAMEVFVWKQDPKKEPGNFGDPLGLNMYTEDMRNKEVSNGRFAMIAVVAMFAATKATGLDAVEQLVSMAGQATTAAVTEATGKDVVEVVAMAGQATTAAVAEATGKDVVEGASMAGKMATAAVAEATGKDVVEGASMAGKMATATATQAKQAVLNAAIK